MEPSTNGANGRGTNGRFTAGNPGGPGNPHAKKVQRLRSAMMKHFTADDLRAVIEAMIREAKDGDVAAAKLLLDRVLGTPAGEDVLSRIESLEQMLSQRNKS